MQAGFLRLILRWVVLPFLALMLALYGFMALLEAATLRPLAERLGTGASKAEVVAHVTTLLKQQKGAPPTAVRQIFEELGGQVTYREGIATGDGSRESVYWTLAELPGSAKIWAVWLLSYDGDGRLTEVKVGESFP